jgi:hypothetical protein
MQHSLRIGGRSIARVQVPEQRTTLETWTPRLSACYRSAHQFSALCCDRGALGNPGRVSLTRGTALRAALRLPCSVAHDKRMCWHVFHYDTLGATSERSLIVTPQTIVELAALAASRSTSVVVMCHCSKRLLVRPLAATFRASRIFGRRSGQGGNLVDQNELSAS